MLNAATDGSWQQFQDNFGVPCCYNKETGSLRVDSSDGGFRELLKRDSERAVASSPPPIGSQEVKLSHAQEALIFMTLHPEVGRSASVFFMFVACELSSG